MDWFLAFSAQAAAEQLAPAMDIRLILSFLDMKENLDAFMLMNTVLVSTVFVPLFLDIEFLKDRIKFLPPIITAVIWESLFWSL